MNNQFTTSRKLYHEIFQFGTEFKKSQPQKFETIYGIIPLMICNKHKHTSNESGLQD